MTKTKTKTVEEKKKREEGGKSKRRLHEIALTVPDVSAYLYSDAPTNNVAKVPFVGMELGASTPGVAYTYWLTTLNLRGYSITTEQGETIEYKAGRKIVTAPGPQNSTRYGWVCSHSDCGWMVTIRMRSKIWVVTKCNVVHTSCESTLAKNKLPMRFVAQSLSAEVQSSSTAAELKRKTAEAGLGTISNRQAQRVLKRAKELAVVDSVDASNEKNTNV